MNAATLNRLSGRTNAHLRQSSDLEPRVASRATDARGNQPQRSRVANKPLPVRMTSGRPVPIESAARSEQRIQAAVRLSLPLLFLIGGYAVGFFLALISLLDLALGVPFYRASALYDTGLFVASVILLYLTYDARDGVRG